MKNNFKSTLNLPETSFSMRGNLAQKEPKIIQKWKDDNLYKLIRNAKKDKPLFILHDGPPYANGNLHMGHAVNKIIKDIIIKAKGLSGFDSPYIPGWDCHGLPIELKVEEKIGKPNHTVSDETFRKACRTYVTEQIKIQKKDFIRMGVLGDWNHSYLTMDFSTEANIIRLLATIISKGYIVRGDKPVYWCIKCCSALSDAEVEYQLKYSPAIDVFFYAKDREKIKSLFKVINVRGPIGLVIWTTTPWSLPANQAVGVQREACYQLVQIKDRAIIIAKILSDKFVQRINLQNWKVIGEVSGTSLEYLQLHHPFMEYDVPIVLSPHVSLEEGTGIVHIAPSLGEEDYLVGINYKLNLENIIDPTGCYKDNTYPDLDGVKIFQANQIIINILQQKRVLLKTETIQHSYPYCWRHKEPIIFRTTGQWFLNIEHQELRKNLLNQISQIQWKPSWGKQRMRHLISSRPDWCLSRQRTWGIPIPLFVEKNNGQLHPDTVCIIEKVAQLVESKGIQAWWDLSSQYLIGKKDAEKYIKVLDTLDVWFDSGSTHIILLQKFFNMTKKKEVDLFFEGSDQYRGWFMSSLIISTILNNKNPCKKILTHGFVVDSQGRKMSKSLGNTISPTEIMNKFGSDILRLWIASTDYTREIVISKESINRSVDIYRRIRNTIRFLLANINDFDPDTQQVNIKNMIALDRLMLQKVHFTQKNIITAYENYEFHKVVQNLMQFCSIELGSFYLDIVKDRQYTSKKNSLLRRSGQTAMFYIVEAMVRWLAPLISFTADEIWGVMPGQRAQYVFTEEWFEQGYNDLNEDHLGNNSFWGELIVLRNEVNKVMEKMRADKKIQASLSSVIELYASGLIEEKLKILGKELKFFLMTSNTKIFSYAIAPTEAYKSNKIENLKFMLSKAPGNKCMRCWHYTLDIGKDVNFPNICSRCVINISGSGEKRFFV
ncbi:MAG: isoleucine--tRNA ligase [Candidatus Dasytiphilus stammeri]